MHFSSTGHCLRARTHPRAILRALVAVFLGWTSLLLLTSTSDAADLSGKWKASSLRVSWSVGDWGKACGPRPSGGGERGGTVTLTPSGGGFKLDGLGRSYSTSQCWERMPGLSPRKHSAGSSTIQTTCRMPSGDPRQATVVTTWYPRGDEIYFDETGQYQFVLEGSNCTASVRRTRVLERIVEQPKPEPADAQKQAEETQPKPGPKPQTTKKAPTAAPPPPPARASQCDDPGRPVRVEVTPKTKLMRVGESFQFQAIARDENGCRAGVRTDWKLVSGSGGELAADGTLTIPESAAPGTLVIEAQVDDQSVEVTARVVTAEEYERLLAGGDYGVMGESLENASIRLSTTHVEFDSDTSDNDQKTTLWVTLAALVALFGLGALILVVRRARHARQSAAPPSSALAEVPDEAAQPDATPAPEPVAKSPARLCPVCGARYEDETMFCPEDGARLVRSN